MEQVLLGVEILPVTVSLYVLPIITEVSDGGGGVVEGLWKKNLIRLFWKTFL